jgi:ApbE superfamily uncharacterized protein (UPF0280 family)
LPEVEEAAGEWRSGKHGTGTRAIGSAALAFPAWADRPRDLVIEPFGAEDAAGRAVARGWTRFTTVLDELVGELALLRRPVEAAEGVTGPVARRMVAACRPHAAVFITPMAAVAGAVADEMIDAMAPEPGLAKLYVNNGGDIALWLGDGERLRIGLVADPRRGTGGVPAAIDGEIEISSDMPVRGIATSGWRGRSFSLGIADSVTVLAASAAAADAAATLIANAVDSDDPAIVKRPASALKDDTDLGDLPVTVAVGPLSRAAVDAALDAGGERAKGLIAQGFAWGAVLTLAGQYRVVGGLDARLPRKPREGLP